MTVRALIADYYAAFNRGDWAGMLALLSDDIAHDLNQGGRQVGRHAFAEFLAQMDRCYREQLTDIRILSDDNASYAAAEYVVHGQYLQDDAGLPAASGQHYQLPGAAFFEVRAGKISRVSNHYNLAEWIRQIQAS
jgi:steroid delta-isomerase-like uncharacterized protein